MSVSVSQLADHEARKKQTESSSSKFWTEIEELDGYYERVSLLNWRRRPWILLTNQCQESTMFIKLHQAPPTRSPSAQLSLGTSSTVIRRTMMPSPLRASTTTIFMDMWRREACEFDFIFLLCLVTETDRSTRARQPSPSLLTCYCFTTYRTGVKKRKFY